MDPHPLEKYVGMRVFVTKRKPRCLGRVLRPEGFKVFEIPLRIKDERCRYPLYRLYKKGVDTIHALKMLGGKWSYAGLKDANAETVQYVTSLDGRWEREIDLGKVRAELVGCLERPLKPGDLRGNSFVIKITYNCDPSFVYDIAKELSFAPGFFGHQRFGTKRPITHLVGKLILLGKFEEAREAFLGEPWPWEGSVEARMKYCEGRAEWPKYLDLERKVYKRGIKGLGGMLKFFLQAYQAYLFNKILSENLRERAWIPGYYSIHASNKAWKETMMRILREEGVGEEHFRRWRLPGKERKGRVKIDLRVKVEGKVATFYFTLPPGYYATVVIREFIKDSPLLL